jgi:proteasome beta subunit
LTCNDGAVLTADTRATAGLFIADRHAMKIHRIDKHLGMTMAGGVADAQNLIDIMRYNANIYRLTNKEPIPVKSAARLCANVLFNNRNFPYYVQIIIGGVDNKNSNEYGNSNNEAVRRSQIYNIDLFGSL